MPSANERASSARQKEAMTADESFQKKLQSAIKKKKREKQE
jgi:hypothetical protein